MAERPITDLDGIKEIVQSTPRIKSKVSIYKYVIWSAVLAALGGGAGYGSYNFFQNRAETTKKEAAKTEKAKEEIKIDKQIELLSALSQGNLEITTILNEGKVDLKKPKKGDSATVKFKDENGQDKSRSFSVTDVETGPAYSIGQGGYEAKATLEIDADGQKFSCVTSAWALRDEESTYTATFNCQ